MIKGQIYKLTSSHTDQIYIGSTKNNLQKRLYNHKSNKKNISPQNIIKYDDCQIILIEEFLYIDRKLLRIREQEIINDLKQTGFNVVNKNRAHFVYDKDEHRIKNKKNVYLYQNKEYLCESCARIIKINNKAPHLKTKKHIDNSNISNNVKKTTVSYLDFLIKDFLGFNSIKDLQY